MTENRSASASSSGAKRHAARSLAVQSLYAAEMKTGETTATEEMERLVSLEPVEKDVDEYVRRLLTAVAANDTADRDIQSVLSSWTIDRVTPVERCILRVGLAEIQGDLGVPPIVAIDEAIRLAKEFGTKNSEKFINGVLDAIYKKKKPAA